MDTIAKTEYDRDFYAWTLHSADLLRHGKISEVDVENVAEEIESMGKSTKRELVNRLIILLAHLIKWKFQNEKRSGSWKGTIKQQRYEINGLLEDSPSLKHEINEKLDRAYVRAVKIASIETGISIDIFPKTCCFSTEQCLDDQFFPD